MSLRSLRSRRVVLAAPSAAMAVALLAGCGGGSSNITSTASGSQVPASSASGTSGDAGGANGAAGSTGQRAFPGASGQIAEIDGKTMQVQNTSTQTAVSFSSATTVTDTVPATRADLKVGDCVQVRDVAAAPGSAATGSPSAPAAPDLTAPITATSVAISDAVDGTCSVAGGFGGFGGQRPANGFAEQRGQASEGAPDAATGSGTGPSRTGTAGPGTANGANRGAFRGGGGAFGKVTAISGDTVTVESTRPAGAPNGSPAGGAVPGSTASTTTTSTRTVTLTPTTTYTKTVRATPSALKVGSCVTALGTPDDTGAIKATSITIRPAVDGTCTDLAFGRGNRGGTTVTNGATNGAANSGTTNATTGATNG